MPFYSFFQRRKKKRKIDSTVSRFRVWRLEIHIDILVKLLRKRRILHPQSAVWVTKYIFVANFVYFELHFAKFRDSQAFYEKFHGKKIDALRNFVISYFAN